MNKTELLTVGSLVASMGLLSCDDSPMGVPDEMKTEKSLEGWSKEMVEEARTEKETSAKVDKDYRPEGDTDYLPGKTEAEAAKDGQND